MRKRGWAKNWKWGIFGGMGKEKPYRKWFKNTGRSYFDMNHKYKTGGSDPGWLGTKQKRKYFW